MPSPYNTTDLDPLRNFEHHVFHRDMFAHYLRWSHVLKEIGRNERVVDFGCGKAQLLEVLYRNRRNPEAYFGFDIRRKTVEAAAEQWVGRVPFPVLFDAVDLVQEPVTTFEQLEADRVCSFEVIEHVGQQNAQAFLERFKACGKPGAIYYLSTPNYDERVGAADNHTYDSGDGRGKVPQEFTYSQLAYEIDVAGFDVVRTFGTFASQRDYEPTLSQEQRVVYEQLKQYYDSNLVSNLMAPIVPAPQARNVLWVLKHD